ncbi:hypothetical protein HU200_062543 [Digitaria exilis]|uniref:Nucleoside diphosphate kinase-like domain-containing protein n=1 Tax=Digitaria exilis TaxID=1010633 RepID=A0A835DX69_9POAL|nr:hypothetical protein HU200_062543 [Digitaria exilis]
MARATSPAARALVGCWLPLLLIIFLYGCCSCGAVERERTLAMIKPDGLSGNYTERIKAAILDSGFHIVKETEVQLDAERASLFYAEHSLRSFFESLIKYITREVGCFILVVLIGLVLLSFVSSALSFVSWVSSLAYPNSLGTKGYVVAVVVVAALGSLEANIKANSL